MKPAELACVFLAAFLAILTMQWRFGAWEREFGFHPDESAHYVTGVMVREYLLSGASEHPLRFAEQYYLRYPRLALGHWPPLFPGVLGAWMVLFGTGKPAVFCLLGMWGAGVCTLLYRLVRLEGSVGWASAAAACWLLFQRQTQLWLGSVMTEIPFTFFCLAALLSYVLYLRRPGRRWAALFGLAASAALLTKGLAVVLAFIPLPAVWAVGRMDLLRRWSFWLPAAVVLALAGPWYALQGSLIPTAFGGLLARLSVARLGSLEERVGALAYSLGPAITLLAAAALAVALLAPRLRGRRSPLAAVGLAYVGGALLLHLALPESSEPRHLFHVIPVLIAAVALAGNWAAKYLPAWAAPAGRLALVAIVAGRLAWPPARAAKPDFALVSLAEELAADSSLDGAVFLVAANGTAEGAFVAETARLAPDPRWFVLRSSKVLAWVNWAPQGEYVETYESAGEVAAYLDSVPVAVVVVSEGQYETLPHDRLLLEAVESSPERWRELPPRSSSNRPFTVRAFRSTRPDLLPQKPIRMDLTRRLGRVIEADPRPSMRAED